MSCSVRRILRAPALAVVASLALLVGAASPAQAELRSYVVRWSSSGGATAVGTLVIDDAELANPGLNESNVTDWAVSLSVSISGASSGNGTFTLYDFNNVILNINDGALDLDAELIAQGLADFNVFALPPFPNGVDPSTMLPAGGTGSDELEVDSITPVSILGDVADDERKCLETLGKAGWKYSSKRHKILAKCRNDLMKGKDLYQDKDKTVPVTTWAECPMERKAEDQIAKAGEKVRKQVEKKCSDALLESLPTCAPTVNEIVNSSGSSGCLIESLDRAVDHELAAEYGF